MAGAPIGNQNAVKAKIIGDALRKIAVQEPGRIRGALLKQVEAAETGDLPAMQFIRDTLDGKPQQSIEANVSASLVDVLAGLGKP